MASPIRPIEESYDRVDLLLRAAGVLQGAWLVFILAAILVGIPNNMWWLGMITLLLPSLLLHDMVERVMGGKVDPDWYHKCGRAQYYLFPALSMLALIIYLFIEGVFSL
jgi:hypothetical protein